MGFVRQLCHALVTVIKEQLWTNQHVRCSNTHTFCFHGYTVWKSITPFKQMVVTNLSPHRPDTVHYTQGRSSFVLYKTCKPRL